MTAATKDAPFVNTLGMKFVPVPITGGPTGGQRVLFSVWETRVQDYDISAQLTGPAAAPAVSLTSTPDLAEIDIDRAREHGFPLKATMEPE